MPYIDKSILEEIESSKHKLDEHKLDIFVDEMFQNLLKECLIQAPVQDEDNARRRDEVVTNFGEAWKWGHQHYQGEFNLVLLQELAGKIEPYQCGGRNGFAPFRSTGATLASLNYTAPADESRIRAHLERVLHVLKRNLHPVEEAVFLYFNIVRIQPFEAGNKRTANMVMNLTLGHNGFPVICVNPRERNIYLSLLDSALKGFRESGATGKDELEPYVRPDPRQRALYDFLGQKVQCKLKASEDTLANLPHYEIIFHTNNPGTMYSAKRKIVSWFASRQASYADRLAVKARTLTVTGEMKYETLEGLLKPIRGMKYTIRTL